MPSLRGKASLMLSWLRVLAYMEGAQEVARHARCWGRRQLVEAHEHREALLAGVMDSTVPGPAGNVEALLVADKP